MSFKLPKLVNRRSLTGASLALILLSLLCIPFYTASRPLTSNEDIARYEMNTLAVQPTIAKMGFSIYLSEDVAAQYDPSDRPELPLAKRAHSHPQRYPKQIAIPVGTYQRTNRCNLALILDGVERSQQVNCADIADNSHVEFRFAQPISPGKHSVDVLWEGSPGNEVAIFAYQGKVANEKWLIPYSGHAKLRLFRLLRSWLYRAPYATVLYIICLIAAVALVLVKKSWSLHAAIFILLIGILAIVRPYSGFDETAHIDMLHERMIDAPEGTARPEFWAKVRIDMLLADFHRLHQIQLNLPAVCPHKVIGYCGHSAGPEKLYELYRKMASPIIALTGWDIGEPSHLLYLSYLFSALWLILTLAALYLLGGKRTFLIFSSILVFYGGFLTQFPSITNDIPHIMYGLLLGGWLYACGVAGQKNRLLVWTLLLFCCYPLALAVHRSGETSLVILASLPIFLLFRKVFSQKMSPKNVSLLKYASITLFMGIVLFGSFFAVKALLTENYFGLQAFLSSKLPNGEFLTYLKKFQSPELCFTFLKQYMKSFFGSYVWGHSYFDWFTYRILFFIYALLSLLGILHIIQRWNKCSMVYLGILAGLIAAQMLVVLTIYMPEIGATTVVRDSFLKTRLSAPGTGVLLVLPALGIDWSFRHKWFSSILTSLGKIWVVILLCYYFPIFFWVDAF